MFLGGFVSFIVLIYMLVKIGKQSVLLAVVSFLFWPALIFAVLKFWGDEESDIKVPFLVFVVAASYAWYDMFSMTKALQEAQQQGLLLMIGAGLA
jgi:hypothetical protein